MGIITDVFVATHAEALSLNIEDEPSDFFPTLYSNGGAGVVELGRLESLLTGCDVQEAIVAHQLVKQLSDEGPWITQVTLSLRQALADLSDDEIAPVGQKWARSEEFELSGWEETDVLGVLRELVTLARHATEENKFLFVRNAV